MNFLRYVAVRTLQTVPVLAGVSAVVFLIVHAAPGDPVVNMLGIQATEENIEAVRAAHGLDQPLYIQYFSWLSNVLQGDFGRSLVQGRAVSDLIVSRLPATLFLAVSSMVVAILIAIPAGMVSAVRKGSKTDFAVTLGALSGISIPNFWLGLLLILFFATSIDLFPAGNYVSPMDDPVGALESVFLPAVTVGTAYAALLTRQTRSAVLENLRSDSVRMAKAKGLSARRIMTAHVLKGALLPVITVAGLQFGYLLSATVVVEQVFAWPGMGRLIWFAVLQQDYPAVQGAVLVVATLFVAINLLVDLTYGYLDPRVSAQ
ncbi:ABC transporter permease [Natronosalvus rutilus]|uniref:ABC transporter permease n=1 Tax=Natronosalvus rutilus TaxID=2953753 RepID=A0A9E7NCV3_9EURY|nr:ABC transporter permease [Natronosalvus rutilus]UTF54605.1 ABC transporter permease [Natronosalvus rutilus]